MKKAKRQPQVQQKKKKKEPSFRVWAALVGALNDIGLALKIVAIIYILYAAT